MKDNKESFFERVYEVVRLIPKGKVTSYGAIARFIGTGNSSRMVGWAMNHSHSFHSPVPAHRVVNRNGLLTGRHHFPGENLMETLLRSEGIHVEENAIIDFKKHFWDPNTELGHGK